MKINNFEDFIDGICIHTLRNNWKARNDLKDISKHKDLFEKAFPRQSHNETAHIQPERADGDTRKDSLNSKELFGE